MRIPWHTYAFSAPPNTTRVLNQSRASRPAATGYHQVTGHWPDFSSQDDLAQLGAEAFAFVNLARFAVPLRIGLALSTVPWVQSNVIDRVNELRGGPPGNGR